MVRLLDNIFSKCWSSSFALANNLVIVVVGTFF